MFRVFCAHSAAPTALVSRLLCAARTVRRAGYARPRPTQMQSLQSLPLLLALPGMRGQQVDFVVRTIPLSPLFEEDSTPAAAAAQQGQYGTFNADASAAYWASAHGMTADCQAQAQGPAQARDIEHVDATPQPAGACPFLIQGGSQDQGQGVESLGDVLMRPVAADSDGRRLAPSEVEPQVPAHTPAATAAAAAVAGHNDDVAELLMDADEKEQELWRHMEAEDRAGQRTASMCGDEGVARTAAPSAFGAVTLAAGLAAGDEPAAGVEAAGGSRRPGTAPPSTSHMPPAAAASSKSPTPHQHQQGGGDLAKAAPTKPAGQPQLDSNGPTGQAHTGSPGAERGGLQAGRSSPAAANPAPAPAKAAGEGQGAPGGVHPQEGAPAPEATRGSPPTVGAQQGQQSPPLQQQQQPSASPAPAAAVAPSKAGKAVAGAACAAKTAAAAARPKAGVAAATKRGAATRPAANAGAGKAATGETAGVGPSGAGPQPKKQRVLPPGATRAGSSAPAASGAAAASKASAPGGPRSSAQPAASVSAPAPADATQPNGKAAGGTAAPGNELTEPSAAAAAKPKAVAPKAVKGKPGSAGMAKAAGARTAGGGEGGRKVAAGGAGKPHGAGKAAHKPAAGGGAAKQTGAALAGGSGSGGAAKGGRRLKRTKSPASSGSRSYSSGRCWAAFRFRVSVLFEGVERCVDSFLSARREHVGPTLCVMLHASRCCPQVPHTEQPAAVTACTAPTEMGAFIGCGATW